MAVFEEGQAPWRPLETEPPGALREARLQAHWALQAVAAAGAALVPSRPDESHTSLSWRDESHLLVGEAIHGGHRVALRPGDLTLAFLAPDGTMEEALALPGQTLRGAFTWLGGILAARSGLASPVDLEVPGYDMPSHPVGGGALFALAEPGHRQQLVGWFANAAQLLEMVSATTDGASPVRCWPHHFDMATLITVDAGEANPEKVRSIGVGMSPGDGSYDQPYFYVNPWPRPTETNLPRLAGKGCWHTEGWTGAVLPASRLVNGSATRDQEEQVTAFLRSAMTACRVLLGAV